MGNPYLESERLAKLIKTHEIVPVRFEYSVTEQSLFFYLL